MLRYAGIAKAFAKSNLNRTAFMLLFAAASYYVSSRSQYPTSMYSGIACIVFLAIAAMHIRLYLKWSFRISDDENIMKEIMKKYNARQLISTAGEVNGIELEQIVSEELGWLKNYARYVLFGAVWGIFYAMETVIFYGWAGGWLTEILFNGIILFVLGKSVTDYFALRLQNPYARMSAIHITGYLPIFIVAWVINYMNLMGSLAGYASDIATRLVLVALTVYAYNLAKIKLPE